MLRSVSDILGYAVEARDGPIGSVYDFYFDQATWAVRYVVVDTGQWLPGKRVLIAPQAVLDADWRQNQLKVGMTREQVKTSPGAATDLPVSRQHEQKLYAHFGWTPYWFAGVAPMHGPGPAPVVPIPASTKPEEHSDPHLHSVREVTGYHIHASDGSIGHVEAFIADTDGWVMRYLVIDTRNWLPGRKVLIARDWIEQINPDARTVNVDVSREHIKASPPYDPAQPINREYENALFDYYGRPAHWDAPVPPR